MLRQDADREENSMWLVKKAQRGDADAFVELIEQNKQAMYKVARSYPVSYTHLDVYKRQIHDDQGAFCGRL